MHVLFQCASKAIFYEEGDGMALYPLPGGTLSYFAYACAFVYIAGAMPENV